MARKRKAKVIPIIPKWEAAHKNLINLNDTAGDGTGYLLVTIEHYGGKKSPSFAFSTNYYESTNLLIKEDASDIMRSLADVIERGIPDDA